MKRREDAAPVAPVDETTTVGYVRALEPCLRSLRERGDAYGARREPMLTAQLESLTNERTIRDAMRTAIADGWVQGFLERALGRSIDLDALVAALERLGGGK